MLDKSLGMELLWIIASFYGVMIILGPLLLHVKIRAAAKIAPQAVTFESLPPQVQAFITPRMPQITSLGFAPVAYYQISSMGRLTSSFMALFSNTQTGEWADVSVVMSARQLRGYIEFIAHCSDTMQVDTNTSSSAPVLFPTPGYHVFRFPQIGDASMLYRAHRMLAEEKLGSARPVLPPPGEEASELGRRLERYGKRQMARGYMYLEASGKSYRLTWKGAILGSWRSTWPVPTLRRWRMKEKGTATLRAIGLAS